MTLCELLFPPTSLVAADISYHKGRAPLISLQVGYQCNESGLGRILLVVLYNEHGALCLLMETSGGRIMHISDPPLLSGLNVNICPPRTKDEVEDCAEHLPFR